MRVAQNAAQVKVKRVFLPQIAAQVKISGVKS